MEKSSFSYIVSSRLVLVYSEEKNKGKKREKERERNKRNIKMELKLNGKIKRKNTCTRYCFRVQEDKL